jgi:hypothetical protein
LWHIFLTLIFWVVPVEQRRHKYIYFYLISPKNTCGFHRKLSLVMKLFLF